MIVLMSGFGKDGCAEAKAPEKTGVHPPLGGFGERTVQKLRQSDAELPHWAIGGTTKSPRPEITRRRAKKDVGGKLFRLDHFYLGRGEFFLAIDFGHSASRFHFF